MNWKLVECEIALIVSLTVIECVNMGQNSPKDITCLTVFLHYDCSVATYWCIATMASLMFSESPERKRVSG